MLKMKKEISSLEIHPKILIGKVIFDMMVWDLLKNNLGWEKQEEAEKIIQ